MPDAFESCERFSDATEDAPLELVGEERPRPPGATHWGVGLQIWPGGDRELGAEADYHGTRLEWLA